MVRINLSNVYGFRPAAVVTAPPSDRPREVRRVVAVDHKLQLDFLYSLNPDCSSNGFATIRILDQPKSGKIAVENGTGFSNFPQNNVRFDCNKRRSDGVLVIYEPNPGFAGSDTVMIDVIYVSGSSAQRRYAIEVR